MDGTALFQFIINIILTPGNILSIKREVGKL